MTLAVDDKQPIVQLPGTTLLRITGTDALEFLSNQFTNNLKALKPGMTSLGTWCSPKGRVLYSFRIWQDEDAYYLHLPADCDVDAMLKRLRMFVLRADVVIEEETQAQCFGLICNNCKDRFTDLPGEDNAMNKRGETTLIKLPGTVKRYLIITPDAPDFEFSDNHDALALWHRHNIVAGIPEITRATSDDFLPQMLDMEHLGGLSFQKGCYPGQEIVARVKYRGELKKMLYKAVIKSSNPVIAGMDLQADFDGQASTVGTVINAAEFGSGRYLVLAVMGIEHAQRTGIQLKTDTNSTFCLFDK